MAPTPGSDSTRAISDVSEGRTGVAKTSSYHVGQTRPQNPSSSAGACLAMPVAPKSAREIAKAIPWRQTTSVRVPSGTQAVQTHGPLHAICITILCTGAPAKLLTELSGCCAHSQAKTGHQLNTTFPPTHPPGWPKTRLKYCFDYALQDFVLLGAKVWPKGE